MRLCYFCYDKGVFHLSISLVISFFSSPVLFPAVIVVIIPVTVSITVAITLAVAITVTITTRFFYTIQDNTGSSHFSILVKLIQHFNERFSGHVKAGNNKGLINIILQ